MLQIGRKITTQVNNRLAISVGLIDRRWSKFNFYQENIHHLSDLFSICGEIIQLGEPEVRLAGHSSLNDLIAAADHWRRSNNDTFHPGLCGRRITRYWNKDQVLIAEKIALEEAEGALSFARDNKADTFVTELNEFDGVIFERYLGPAEETFRGLTPDEFLQTSWQTVQESAIALQRKF